MFHDIAKNPGPTLPQDFNFSVICNKELDSNLHIGSEGRAPLITYSCEQLLDLRASSNALECTMIQALKNANTLRKERPRAERLVRFRKFNRQRERTLITLISSTESPIIRENNGGFDRSGETVHSFNRCQGGVNWKNLASVDKGPSSMGLLPVPKSLFLNICSLDKIKNRVRASVALAADFRTWDIDVGVISETHLCSLKPDSIVAIEGVYDISKGQRLGWNR